MYSEMSRPANSIFPPIFGGMLCFMCNTAQNLRKAKIFRATLTRRRGVGMSGWCHWRKCSPNGVIQWLLEKPWTSSIGQCVWYLNGTPPWPSKWPAKLVHLSSMFCLLSPWRPPGQYGVSSCPMAVSSGFQCSHGHATLGDVVYITPLHRHGYQNDPRQMHICFPPPPFLFT